MVAAAIPVSLSFNIDVTNPVVYNGERKDFFGYKVFQFIAGENKGIIVAAPLQRNGSGGICKHDKYQNVCFSRDEFADGDKTIPIKHLGLSIAVNSMHSQFTVCSPSVAHKCYKNSYLNSVCYKMTSDLQEISSFTPGFQECTKRKVDLVFLFDGSKSMNEVDFDQNKNFIKDIMNNLKNTSIQFAAVQFATAVRGVFDFNDYQNGTAFEKLRKESHLNTLTNTHQALEFVLKNLFENKDAGASPDPTKVLVLITDGDPSDTDNNNIIKAYDEKNIIRFVIGVNIFSLDKVKTIASEPKENNTFRIENYNGLTGILENFQENIFKMEGSKVSRAGDMTEEMSQSGFSAVYYEDTLILGSVGSNSWRGSLYEVHKETERQTEDPFMQMDSYLGYSVSVGKMNNTALYFTGAPRYEHRGQVVVFSHDSNNLSVVQRLDGAQIGSYFGAELCSVDIDSDGNIDFLLVGAPMFYLSQEKTEGRIYIYTLTEKMQLKSELNVTAQSMGRFGSSIASLEDLNGDGLRDVAVGTPLEDESRGVVYIYLGDRHSGICGTFSQRIMGKEISSGLRFFGQAINGDMDLGEDGLPDIVIGSYGTAVVLRSRPIFNVTARLFFHPAEINTEKFDCLSSTDIHLPMITLTACFDMTEATNSNAEAMNLGLNISYTLDVDLMRQTSRGFFNETGRKARSLTSTYELQDKETCLNHTVYLPKCVMNTFSPICIKLNFSQVDGENANATLNIDARTQAAIEVPFKKECRKNDACIADLEVDFNFTTSTLLVAENNYLSMTITLSNHGDDSYNTSLTLYCPSGLSFSRMTLIKFTRPTLHICDNRDEVFNKIICNISHPVYRSHSTATFTAFFFILTEHDWNDTISVGISGKSDNANSTRASLTKSLPVQFQIKMALTVKEDTISYVNFTSEDTAPKKILTIYKVDNPGVQAYSVNVYLIFPTKLEHTFEMSNYTVSVEQNKTQCTAVTDVNSDASRMWQDCTQEKYCKIIVCDSFILENGSATEFTLSGDVHLQDLERASKLAFQKRYTGHKEEVKFKSFMVVDYDRQRYVLHSHKKEERDGPGLGKDGDPIIKWIEVPVEFIILPNQMTIAVISAGAGLLLLIIIAVIMKKLGCFKRKTVEYYQKLEGQAALQASAPPETGPAQSNGTGSQSKSDQLAEEKSLLEKVDDSHPSADTEIALD
ncbi:integrin alpha-L [Aulostomus maculatus]